MSSPEKDPWKAATFEGARRAQNEEMKERPLIERLRWCCEMSEMIRLHDIKAGKTPPALRDRYG